MEEESDDFDTFVFLDLETTGLYCSKVRMMELGLIAVGRRELSSLHMKFRNMNIKSCPTADLKKVIRAIDDEVSSSEGENHVEANNEMDFSRAHLETILPRVLNKLVLCFYPMTTVHPFSTDITGLDNENLQNQTIFNKNVFNTISSFLSGLKGNVCLVAHNGHKFDFPVLQAELSKIDGRLHDDVFCVDSLLIFRDIFKSEIPTNASDPSSYETPCKKPRVSPEPEDDGLEFRRGMPSVTLANDPHENLGHLDLPDDVAEAARLANETTPNRPIRARAPTAPAKDESRSHHWPNGESARRVLDFTANGAKPRCFNLGCRT